MYICMLRVNIQEKHMQRWFFIKGLKYFIQGPQSNIGYATEEILNLVAFLLSFNICMYALTN